MAKSQLPETVIRHDARREVSIYEQLRDLIIRGRLAPGTRVIEADVATRLGVSRTPAREAIQRLHQEGFLTVVAPGLRTQLVVAPLTQEDVQELYLIMGSLEGAAARTVGDLAPGVCRTLARDLRAANVEFEKEGRIRPVDFDRLFDLHNAFHQCLIDICAGPRLRALLDAVRPQVDRYEWIYAPLVGPDFKDTIEEHLAIIRAIREGQADAAEEAVRANWRNGAARLSRVIDRIGARGDW